MNIPKILKKILSLPRHKVNRYIEVQAGNSMSHFNWFDRYNNVEARQVGL